MKRLTIWFAGAWILVMVFGTMYAVTQQAQRHTANLPQIQLAEDAAAQLDLGVSPPSLLSGRVDITKSLAPFVIIYDKHGTAAAGTGFIGNTIPAAPLGVLTSAEGKEYHTVSWQPTNDTRIAAVTVAAKNYYVLSGRNLRQIEADEQHTMQLAFLGGFISLAPLTIALWPEPVMRRLKPILQKLA